MKTTAFSNLRNLISGNADQSGEGQEPENDGALAEGDDGEGNADEGDGEGQEADGADGDQNGDSQAAQFVGQGSLATASTVLTNANDTFAAGVTAERRRWAEVLTSEEAAGKFELAADLLAEDMPAASIKRVLKGQAASTGSRLKSVPRHDLRATPQSEGGEGTADRAAESRKKAVKNVNSGRGGQKQKKDA